MEVTTARKPSDYDVVPSDIVKGPEHISLKYLNKRLVSYGITRRKHDEKGRRTDRILHLDPKLAINQLSEHQFRLTFGQWFWNVEYAILCHFFPFLSLFFSEILSLIYLYFCHVLSLPITSVFYL